MSAAGLAKSHSLLARRRWLLTALVTIAAVAMLATLIPIATDTSYNYSRDSYYDAYQSLAYSGRELTDADHREMSKLDRIMGEKDQAAYCREVRSYEFALLKSQKAQGQSGDSAAGRLDTFTHAFLDTVCGLRSPTLYEGTSDLPGLVLRAFYLGTVPSPLLLLAPFVLLWAVARECACSRLLSHAPFSPLGTWLYFGAFGALLALACSFVPMLPAVALATVRNGSGDVTYPVIYWQADALVRSTVGQELLLYAAVFLIAGFCLGSLCSLSASLRSSSVMIAGLFLLVPPLLDNSYSLGALFPNVFAVLPSTYFSAGRIFGRLGGTGATNAIPIAGASAPSARPLSA